MITISVVTPTFRREDLLARCVSSVLSQEVPGVAVEHIVVNDAGEPLSPAPWMGDPRVRVLDTRRTERAVARNTGAALSSGSWLYFLDDDDYALPGAFQAMAEMAAGTEAGLLYGAYRILNQTTGDECDIAPTLPEDIFPLLVAGEVLPTVSVWIRRDVFFNVGGFDPLLVQAEDVDLFRRVAMAAPAAGVSAVIAAARVDHPGTTTTVPRENRSKLSLSLENCLRQQETLPRLLRFSAARPYWGGRSVRRYLASAARSCSHRDYVTALDWSAACLRLSAGHVFRRQFWAGVRNTSEAAR